MLTPTKTLLLATAAAISMPALATAATLVSTTNLVANANYALTSVISPGERIEFRFFVMEDLEIDDFSVSGTGTDFEEDLLEITYGLTNPPTENFSVFQNIGSAAAAFGFLDGAIFQAGSTFSFFFGDGIDNDVGVTVSFETGTIAPIPLPASGLLMLPVLLGGGFAAWRRRRGQKAAA